MWASVHVSIIATRLRMVLGTGAKNKSDRLAQGKSCRATPLVKIKFG